MVPQQCLFLTKKYSSVTCTIIVSGNCFVPVKLSPLQELEQKDTMVTISQPTHAQLHSPIGAMVSSTDQVYISEGDGHRIRKIDRNGIISTIAGNGVGGYNGDGKLAVNAQLYHPRGLFVGEDEEGREEVWIAEYGSNLVRKIDGLGRISTIAGTGGFGYNGDDQLATRANYKSDWKWNMWIADFGNQRVRKIDGNGIVTTIAGTGVKGYSGDVEFDFNKYPHIGPRKKPLIQPFPKSYHDLIIITNY